MHSIVRTGNIQVTPEMIQKAQANHSYIRVSGQPSTSISLVGAPKVFGPKSKTPDYVYVPELQLVGTPNDLYRTITALPSRTGQPYTPEEAEGFIENGFSAQNYNVPEAEGGKKEEFEAALNEAREARKSIREAKPKPLPVSLDNLPYIYDSIIGVEKEATRTRTGTSGARRGRTLLEKYNIAQDAGKVLDVTSMQPNGVGVREVNPPGPKSGKIMVDNVPVISSNPQTYAMAIHELFGNGQEAQNLIAQFNQLAASKAAKPKAKKAAVNVVSTRRGRTSPPNVGTSYVAPAAPRVSPSTSPRRVSPRQTQQQMQREVQQTQAQMPSRANTGLPSLGGLSRLGANRNIPSANRPAFGSPEE